jgi:hypothetical protein
VSFHAVPPVCFLSITFRCVCRDRLLQRGQKTLKDRMRLQAVDLRLGELNSDISHLRKELSVKPG